MSGTYGIVRMFGQDTGQKIWHPLLHRVWVAIYERAYSQDGGMPLPYCSIVGGICSARQMAILRKTNKAVLGRGIELRVSEWTSKKNLPSE